MIHFYYVRPHLNYCIQLLDPLPILEKIWQRVIKMINSLQHIVYEKLRYLDLLTGNRHKLQLGRFTQGIMNTFFITRMLKNDSPALRLYRGLVGSPFMDVYRM